MQIRFRYTDTEFTNVRRVNRMLGVPRWKIFGLVLLCLVPSFLLTIFAFSFIAILAFAMIAAVLLAMMAWSIVRQPKLIDKRDHLLTLTTESMREESSESAYEVRWHHFDEMIETDDEFQFRRLERFVIFPKRIFTRQQCIELREFGSLVARQPPENEPPINLFEQHFAGSNQFPPIQFAYQQDDLRQAALDRFQLIDTSTVQRRPHRPVANRFLTIWVVIFFVCLPLYLLSTANPPGERLGRTQQIILALVVLLPFVLLLGSIRFIRARELRQLPQVPPDTTNLTLNRSGFAVGTPTSVTYTDWQDIDAFYENRSCFGLKSFNDLVQVIPKRIFANEVESADFLDQVIVMHRERQRGNIVEATAVETGNPYQPPRVN